MSKDYEVGYAKPPRSTQFKKGQSGNSKGRPKGTKNLKTDLIEELSEQIIVREGSVQKKVSKQRAMVKSLVIKAAQGDPKASTLLITMMLRLFGEEDGEPIEVPLSSDDAAILENMIARQTTTPEILETSSDEEGAS